jgi:hypothetical protein
VASLKGYHTPARGQSRTTHAPVLSRGCPRGGAWSGYLPPTDSRSTPPEHNGQMDCVQPKPPQEFLDQTEPSNLVLAA